jgi:hypothetical protein
MAKVGVSGEGGGRREWREEDATFSLLPRRERKVAGMNEVGRGREDAGVDGEQQRSSASGWRE